MKPLLSLLVLIALAVQAGAATVERSMFWFPLTNSTPALGRPEITNGLNVAVSAGLNTVHPYLFSSYLNNVVTNAQWDSFADIVSAATTLGLNVVAWYAPTIDKAAPYGVETAAHPEWAQVQDDLVTARLESVCFVRPEVRAWEYDYIKALVDRYPTIAGVHLEEPGTVQGNCCWCVACTNALWTEKGLAIAPPWPPVLAGLQDIRIAALNNLVSNVNLYLSAAHPTMKLEANGSYYAHVTDDQQRGRDWPTWASNNWIQVYTPQVYTSDPAWWGGIVYSNKALLASCAQVPSIGIIWSGGYNTPYGVTMEVRAAGTNSVGFNIFRREFLTNEIVTAIQAGYNPNVSIMRNAWLRQCTIR